MRRAAALVCAAALSATAAAEVTPREAALRDPALVPAPIALERPRLGWSLFAQSLAEASFGDRAVDGGGALAAGGELRLDGRVCRILTVGGDLRATLAGDGRDLGGDGWLSLCLVKGLPLPTLTLDARAAVNAHPSFDSAPLAWRRPYSDVELTLGVTFVDADRGRSRLQLVAARFPISLAWQRDDARARLLLDGAAALDLVRWLRTDGRRADDDPLTLAAVAVRMDLLGGDAPAFASASAFSVAPLRAGAVPLDGRALLLDGEVAFANAEVTAGGGADAKTRGRSALAGALALRGARGRLGFGVGWRRGLDVSRDGDLVLDDRVTAWARVGLGAAELRLASFAARTSVAPLAGGDTVAWTGGGEARLGVPLGRHLRLGVTSEAARTFYGRVGDGDARPRPGVGVRVLGVLTAALNR